MSSHALAPPSVAVVIPYFQRSPGILARAVASALDQHGCEHAVIIVVDDASPVSALAELTALMAIHPGRVRVLEQANGGPAAARNTALHAVASGTRYVAFLDSDDQWTPDHLQRALLALEQGMDLYFSDHYQLNQSVSAFRRADRMAADAHPPLDAAADLHSYQGDMFDQILSGNVIGTSTVVYRHAAWPALRFREDYVCAGEDYLFWLELSRLTSRIAFSTRCECTYGAGVNVFSGAGWGTPGALLRMHYEIKFNKAVPRLFALSRTQRDARWHAVRTLRRGFVAALVHGALHRQPLAPGLLLRHWRIDPQTFCYALPLLLGIAWQRLLSKK
jgi:succinoglycan biosynthesis protein ExoW